MLAHYEVISKHIAQWEQHFVEPDVFGTTDPHTIAELIDLFCQTELGTPVEEYLLYEASIGAVCGVRLVDQRRVVVKVHHARTLAFLQAMVQVQRHLLAHNYPCTKPLLAPRPLAHGIATTEELMDEGVYHEAYDPAIRRSMAEMLAQRDNELFEQLADEEMDTSLLIFLPLVVFSTSDGLALLQKEKAPQKEEGFFLQ